MIVNDLEVGDRLLPIQDGDSLSWMVIRYRKIAGDLVVTSPSISWLDDPEALLDRAVLIVDSVSGEE